MRDEEQTQEGKRARGQEGKRARGQEGKRARGQEEDDEGNEVFESFDSQRTMTTLSMSQKRYKGKRS
jgi:hypothetical protein